VLELRRGQESDDRSRAELERAQEDLRGREEELERLRVRALTEWLPDFCKIPSKFLSKFCQNSSIFLSDFCQSYQDDTSTCFANFFWIWKESNGICWAGWKGAGWSYASNIVSLFFEHLCWKLGGPLQIYFLADFEASLPVDEKVTLVLETTVLEDVVRYRITVRNQAS
jgi:hypothetical protein